MLRRVAAPTSPIHLHEEVLAFLSRGRTEAQSVFLDELVDRLLNKDIYLIQTVGMRGASTEKPASAVQNKTRTKSLTEG